MVCQAQFGCMHGHCAPIDNSSSELVCVCDPGWSHDNSLFHLNNCSLPEHALLGIFIAFGLVAALPLLLYFAYIANQAKGRMRKTGLFVCLSCSSFFLSSLVLYLENGTFIVMSIMLGVNMAALNFVSENILKMTMAPVVAVQQKKFDRRLIRNIDRIYIGFRISIITMGCIQAGFSQTPYHNYCILAYLIFTCVITVISSALQSKYVGQSTSIIKQNLFSSSPGAVSAGAESRQLNLDEVCGRLEKLQRSLKIFTFYTVVIYLTIVGLFLGMGQQLPYVWCLWIVICMSTFIRYYSCAVLLTKHSHAGSGSRSKDVSPTGSKGQLEAAVEGTDNTKALEVVPRSDFGS